VNAGERQRRGGEWLAKVACVWEREHSTGLSPHAACQLLPQVGAAECLLLCGSPARYLCCHPCSHCWVQQAGPQRCIPGCSIWLAAPPAPNRLQSCCHVLLLLLLLQLLRSHLLCCLLAPAAHQAPLQVAQTPQ
jgi:hypothetical protein